MASAVKKHNYERQVDTKERLAFYVSSFFRDMSYALIGGYLTLFYIDIMGFAGTAALIVIPIITRLWDGVNDPLLGAYFDKRSYGKEKARPIFKSTSIVVAVLIVLMFYAPKFSENPYTDYVIKSIYAVITYIILEAMHTLNGTAFMSLYNSISENPDERTEIISIARLFSTAGTGVVGGLVPILLGFFRNDDVVAKTYIYLGVACFVAVTFLIYNALMYRFVHERGIVPPPEKQKILPMFKRFTQNKLILLIILSSCISNFINYGTIQLYFYTYNMGSPSLQTIFYIFTIPSFLLGTFLVPKLTKRFNKRDLMIACYLVMALANGLFLFAGYKPPVWVVLTVLFLNNIPFCIKGVLYWSMVADSVDYGEWKTGYRNDGLIYAIEGCASKIIGSVGAIFTGVVISAINYIPNAAYQTESTMKGLFYIPQIVIVVTSLLSVIPFLFYDLDRKKHEKILGELKQRKSAAQLQGEEMHQS